MSYRSSSVSAAIASFEIFGGGSSRCEGRYVNDRPRLARLPYLDFLGCSSDVERQGVARTLVMEKSMVPIPGTPTIETMETNIQTGIAILEKIQVRPMEQTECTGERTTESKHWVQSSRYTAWEGPGGFRSGQLVSGWG